VVGGDEAVGVGLGGGVVALVVTGDVVVGAGAVDGAIDSWVVQPRTPIDAVLNRANDRNGVIGASLP
jgi:hypothetical protein